MTSRTVYPGGWVRTTLLSGRFVPDDPACEECRRATCGPYYFQLDRKAVRCRRCFEASLDSGWRWVATGRVS